MRDGVREQRREREEDNEQIMHFCTDRMIVQFHRQRSYGFLDLCTLHVHLT